MHQRAVRDEGSLEKYGLTVGWGYATCVGDSTSQSLAQGMVVDCYDCYTAAGALNHVFSQNCQ